MSMQEAEQRIAECRRSKSTELDLRLLGLRTVPDSVTQLINLKRLFLGSNQLSSLPETINQLINLTQLDLRSNQLGSVPEAITQLTNLQLLYLSDNQLSNLPEVITQLTNLQLLSLSNNQLSNLPEVITQLTNLKRLFLSSNQLKSLPNAISQLTNLAQLDISDNQLKRLPEAITQLINLTQLDLSDNQLNSLPNAIAQLTELKILYVNRNQLSSLPDSIIRLTNLSYLNINHNPLETPPLEVASRGIKAIKDYFAEKAVASDLADVPLFESKLLLVGEGRVGKTSLSKALRIPNYRLEDEQSTEGIDIQHWTLPKAATGLAEDFRLNVWDFGGQEIYHATHQFFLTRRSLYLMVTESRQEDKHDDFYYWFNVIRLLGSNAPVVVVLNKCDQPVKELPIDEYKKAFDNIVEYAKVSCAPGYATTIEALRAVICRLLTDEQRMAHVGAKLPGVWVQIRQEIVELQEQGLDYIPYQRFLSICASHNMVEDRRVRLLAGYFHDLGIFLHFEDDWDLSDTVILNPEWVTDGVYKVLDNPTVKAQAGRFSDADLRHIWSNAKYWAKRRELLALMKNTKFELCYELPSVNGQKAGYLAPQLLPVDEIPYAWRTHDDNLRFEYRYKFMPKGILARFIVKRHKEIVQAINDKGQGAQQTRPVHWRYGVLLEWGATRALVRERYFERKITVALEGQNKPGFLAIIRRSIEEIHDDFNNLEVDEMVPCNCDECRAAHKPHFFRHTLLERYLRKGRYHITCDNSLEDVDVRTMLREAIPFEVERDERYPIYVGGSYGGGEHIDVGNNADAENIALGHDIDMQVEQGEEYRSDPYRRLPPPRAGDFSRPVPGPELALDHVAQEVLHKALLDAFDPSDMRRLLNFRLNRQMDEISLGQNQQELFFEVIQAAERQGWTGALVEQAYRVNTGNPLLRAFVAQHLPGLLDAVA
ncbi:MAG: COR domain-containing protein [Caldilineaceae bacterium]